MKQGAVSSAVQGGGKRRAGTLGSIREVSVPRLPSLKPQSPRLGLFTLSYQFGLRTISGIVPVSWAALLTLPARMRDNC